MTNDNIVHIWTDGACIGNPGPGGWAIVKSFGGQTRVKSGSVFGITTSNQMELVAVNQAIRSLKRDDLPAIIHTDSQYLAKGLNDYFANWVAKGWRNSSGKPVANRELWEDLWRLTDRRAPNAKVTVAWVRGHAGCAENEQADQLAEAAARRAEQAVGRGTEMPTQFDAESGLVVPLFSYLGDA